MWVAALRTSVMPDARLILIEWNPTESTATCQPQNNRLPVSPIQSRFGFFSVATFNTQMSDVVYRLLACHRNRYTRFTAVPPGVNMLG